MKFHHRYWGHSHAHSTASATALHFAPDTLRSPVFFQAEVDQHLPFREAISALHDVVVSDLRPAHKDRSAYLAWLQENEAALLADFMAQGQQLREQMAPLQAELDALRQHKARLLAPFEKAQRKYFNYLYRTNIDAWVVLDPVITVHPDSVFFECFSRDESTYACLSCSHEAFARTGELAYGTTNIDYSSGLYEEFQKIRDYRHTTLAIAADGFVVQHGQETAFVETQIDLPDSWVRGFLQVSSAMALPARTVHLQPMDVYNLCHALRRRKERGGPRSIRFQLTPNAPVRMVLDPWALTIDCPRSLYSAPAGAATEEIRIWGRRRLLTLERLIPVAQSFTVHLLGYGLPSFWVAHLPGGIRYTLGLSGWTANDWARHGAFDLLAPRHSVAAADRARVLTALQNRWLASTEALCGDTGLGAACVTAALTLLTQAGRVVFDIDQRLWRLRELSAQPLPLEQLRFASEREEGASRLLQQSGWKIPVQIDHTPEGGQRLQAQIADGGKRYAVVLEIDADARIHTGQCQCSFFQHNHLRRGPCEHMLAARMAQTAQHVLRAEQA